ncbi:hypothetical protein APHAL10511_005123 [Amanita phalloides]|nr:hypothetical protein APHAL10511_005123 [Amanita phalloides]
MATRNEEFYIDDMVVIRVEDQLFKVPQHVLTANSPVFRDMFNMPIPKDSQPDGSSDEQPLVLEGLKASGFARLLKCIYPFKFRPAPSKLEFSLEEWKEVLKLSASYEMTEVKAWIVKEMTPLVDHYPTLLVHLSLVYDVKPWLASGAYDLVSRAEPLTETDIKVIGPSYAAKIMSLREDRHHGHDDNKFVSQMKSPFPFNINNSTFRTRLGLL